MEHHAGTRARTMLRVRRNVLGVLPIPMNTRGCSLGSLMQPLHADRSSSALRPTQEVVDLSRNERLPLREPHGAPRTTITTSDSMAPCPQPSHQRLSGLAYPADQELQHDHVLRHGARGAARGRERRQGRARGTLLALRDPSGDDAGNGGATSVPTDGPAAYNSCKEGCS